MRNKYGYPQHSVVSAQHSRRRSHAGHQVSESYKKPSGRYQRSQSSILQTALQRLASHGWMLSQPVSRAWVLLAFPLGCIVGVFL